MGKNKLSRFRELENLERVFQPSIEEVIRTDYRLKGRWNAEVFGRELPLVIELGCGKGEYTVGLARMNPGRNYIGLDIKGARIWKGARQAHEEDLKHVAFLRTRIDFINSFFAKDEVDELWITFPDPQEKKRRQKKRLTGPLFLNRYRQLLKDQGLVHLKTDNRDLYAYTLELVRYNGLQVERHSDDLYSEEWNDETVSIETYYESRFRAEGSAIHYLGFRLPAAKEIRDLPCEM